VRVGLLGGTFNPPHVAHLVCAQEARVQLGLDEVLLVPVLKPPHKDVPDDPGPEHRLAMCRAAAEADAGLGVSDVELGLPAPSYTVATLRALHERRPGDELTFIVGGDMAASLASWREPEALLELARLGVAERAENRRETIAARLADELPGAPERMDFFAMPRLDVSSTDIRARVAEGRPIRWLVPDGVATYVRAHGLYTAPVTA
jgi:nicotinate-nucleotide adenylyltransferase